MYVWWLLCGFSYLHMHIYIYTNIEYDWWPCCRPFAPGCKAILDCHCVVPEEAINMTAPEEEEFSDSDEDDDNDSDDSGYSSSTGSSSNTNSTAVDERFYSS
jgi:hypothetical protein